MYGPCYRSVSQPHPVKTGMAKSIDDGLMLLASDRVVALALPQRLKDLLAFRATCGRLS